MVSTEHTSTERPTHGGVVTSGIVRLRINKVVLDEHIFSRYGPAPCNGFDDLEVLEEAVGDIKCGQVRSESLYDFDSGGVKVETSENLNAPESRCPTIVDQSCRTGRIGNSWNPRFGHRFLGCITRVRRMAMRPISRGRRVDVDKINILLVR